MLIDNFNDQGLVSELGTRWRGVSDRVMGGTSEVSVSHGVINCRPCLHLTGNVNLENNGGFIQATLELTPRRQRLDASNFTGVRLIVCGRPEEYSVHLRTRDNVRPWQSYRAHFATGPDWKSVDLPFNDFSPYRLESPLDRTQLHRIGLVAIGRAFYADLAISQLDFYA